MEPPHKTSINDSLFNNLKSCFSLIIAHYLDTAALMIISKDKMENYVQTTFGCINTIA